MNNPAVIKTYGIELKKVYGFERISFMLVEFQII